MKKKILITIGAVTLSLATFSVGVYAASDIKLFINGKQTNADIQVIDGSSYVPLRVVSESLGAEIKWDENNRTIAINSNSVGNSTPLSSTTTPDVDKLIRSLGKDGANIAYQVQYATLGGGIGQLVFSLNVNSTDRSKDKEYSQLMNEAVDTNVMQIRVDYLDGMSSFIQTQNTKDYWAGKITADEYIKTIKIVNNNAPTGSSTAPNVTAPNSGSSVIESKIDGDFEGFESDKIFKLLNGQIWQQTDFTYNYTYKYSPKVTIYKDGSNYYMIVDGVDKKVTVTQLK